MAPSDRDSTQQSPCWPHQASGALLLDCQSSESSQGLRRMLIDIFLESDRRRQLFACAFYEHRHCMLRAVRLKVGEKLIRGRSKCSIKRNSELPYRMRPDRIWPYSDPFLSVGEALLGKPRWKLEPSAGTSFFLFHLQENSLSHLNASSASEGPGRSGTHRQLAPTWRHRWWMLKRAWRVQVQR